MYPSAFYPVQGKALEEPRAHQRCNEQVLAEMTNREQGRNGDKTKDRNRNEQANGVIVK
jgi:hypothetical protein